MMQQKEEQQKDPPLVTQVMTAIGYGISEQQIWYYEAHENKSQGEIVEKASGADMSNLTVTALGDNIVFENNFCFNKDKPEESFGLTGVRYSQKSGRIEGTYNKAGKDGDWSNGIFVGKLRSNLFCDTKVTTPTVEKIDEKTGEVKQVKEKKVTFHTLGEGAENIIKTRLEENFDHIKRGAHKGIKAGLFVQNILLPETTSQDSKAVKEEGVGHLISVLVNYNAAGVAQVYIFDPAGLTTKNPYKETLVDFLIKEFGEGNVHQNETNYQSTEDSKDQCMPLVNDFTERAMKAFRYDKNIDFSSLNVSVPYEMVESNNYYRYEGSNFGIPDPNNSLQELSKIEEIMQPNGEKNLQPVQKPITPELKLRFYKKYIDTIKSNFTAYSEQQKDVGANVGVPNSVFNRGNKFYKQGNSSEGKVASMAFKNFLKPGFIESKINTAADKYNEYKEKANGYLAGRIGFKILDALLVPFKFLNPFYSFVDYAKAGYYQDGDKVQIEQGSGIFGRSKVRTKFNEPEENKAAKNRYEFNYKAFAVAGVVLGLLLFFLIPAQGFILASLVPALLVGSALFGAGVLGTRFYLNEKYKTDRGMINSKMGIDQGSKLKGIIKGFFGKDFLVIRKKNNIYKDRSLYFHPDQGFKQNEPTDKAFKAGAKGLIDARQYRKVMGDNTTANNHTNFYNHLLKVQQIQHKLVPKGQDIKAASIIHNPQTGVMTTVKKQTNVKQKS